MSYNPCDGCSGEDCCCCEVYIERQVDMKADQERDPSEYEGEYDDDLGFDEEDFEDDERDGDATSALASAGMGTDEDYEHDTPLGEQYGDGFDDYFYGEE